MTCILQVNHVVDSDAVSKAIDIATEIANAGPVAVRAAKRAINQGIDVPLQQALKSVSPESIQLTDCVALDKMFGQERRYTASCEKPHASPEPWHGGSPCVKARSYPIGIVHSAVTLLWADIQWPV